MIHKHSACNDIRYIFVKILYLENIKNYNYFTGKILGKTIVVKVHCFSKYALMTSYIMHFCIFLSTIQTQDMRTTNSKISFYLHCYKCHFN